MQVSLPPITTLIPDLQYMKFFYDTEIIQPISQSKTKNNSLKCKFTSEEDKKLIELATESASRNWIVIAQKLGTRNAGSLLIL
ncbi:hypothetical protein TVAG_397520 [Trichomonas vaginalis G3]|uniref:Uncharacterized protein n=1 Tax=Trichomonas vaginalis (strain ATCC PRA-98 / G3) TaxID=412133 RepID=A2G1C9_TRIV3|nr:hypothetical protein TVAG_397520 [Trichomonas vaginalis G3]|eukprot:XP_001301975.1 hypothetical protein [Trichomonas vaginalis G3]